MRARDMALAAATSVIWGLAFVAVRLGLDSFSAPQLTAIRFLIACLPVAVVPRPRLSWTSLLLIGTTLFTGQFMLLFFAYTAGLPPGLASVSRDRPARSGPRSRPRRLVGRDPRHRAERSVSPMSLAEPRIQRFLDGKDVVVLATVQRDGSPLAMPMWFLHDPAALTMISIAGTQKVRNLHRDPRVCVVAEGGPTGDVRGVAVHGRAEFLGDGPERRALAERLLEKYGPYLERRWSGRAMPADRVMFRIVPTRVRSWGLG